MLEFKLDDKVPVATIYREGKEKCKIDYNHLRRCLLNPDRDIAQLVVGQLLLALEMDGTTFTKLSKEELRTYGQFLDALQTGRENIKKDS